MDYETEMLVRKIERYCHRRKIKGSFNNKFEGQLVSFEVKEIADKTEKSEVKK